MIFKCCLMNSFLRRAVCCVLLLGVSTAWAFNLKKAYFQVNGCVQERFVMGAKG